MITKKTLWSKGDNGDIFETFYIKTGNFGDILYESNCKHCIKYCNYTWFPGVEILWKGSVSAEFRGIGILRSEFLNIYLQICLYHFVFSS